MSRKGNYWGNAPTEHFFRCLKSKSERLTAGRFLNRNDARNEILDYITYYNSSRLHSTLRNLSLMEYEKEQYLRAA
jgi:transposase InsO family protein